MKMYILCGSYAMGETTTRGIYNSLEKALRKAKLLGKLFEGYIAVYDIFSDTIEEKITL